MALDENPLHNVALLSSSSLRGGARATPASRTRSRCPRTLVRIGRTRTIRNMTDVLGAWIACEPKQSSGSAALGVLDARIDLRGTPSLARRFARRGRDPAFTLWFGFLRSRNRGNIAGEVETWESS